MSKLRDFDEGIEKLIKKADSAIYVVKILKAQQPAYFADEIMRDLIASGLEIQEVYSYIPPPGIAWNKHFREEIIPQIKNPNTLYVIVDDYLGQGSTLEHAVEMLKSQEVPIKNMWFLVNELDGYSNGSGLVYLDKAKHFLELVH